MHTSPLSQPGEGDAGGMNVYLDQLSRTMADRGIDITVFTRRVDAAIPTVTEVRERYNVVQIEAGPIAPIPIPAMRPYAGDFANNVERWVRSRGTDLDIVHSHYWLSGRSGVRLKDSLGIPLANSFHTLGKVKDAARMNNERPSSTDRLLTEQEVIARSDCVIASTPYEFDDLLEHYGASPERLCVSPPGVDHDIFRPGDKAQARRRLGFGDHHIVLFVGRVQAHKGTDVAVQTLTHLVEREAQGAPDTALHIIGGASGRDGDDELARCHDTIARNGLGDHVRFFDPLPHDELADHYRAADVVIVPSRSESFGLVAAEAQACGTPVVAANTGGLPYVVNASESGLLVDHHDPRTFATAIAAILDYPSFAERLATGGVTFSKKFSWEATAERLLELYEGLTS
ncbi:MAG: glycosyltransferase [Actinomycetota bacterium]